MSLETFLMLLLAVSVFDSLFTEAVKQVLNSVKVSFSSNMLAGIISVFLSAVVYTGYLIIMGLTINSISVFYLVALILLSWLSAMVGYDKVVQAIAQIAVKTKGE